MKLLSTKTVDIIDVKANFGYCQSAEQLSKKAYQSAQQHEYRCRFT
jgi:hypothetical protein